MDHHSEVAQSSLVRVDAPRMDPRDPIVAWHFLEFLRERGVLDASARGRAAAVQRETRERIDVVISELGLVPAPALLAALSAFFGYPIMGETALPAFAVLEEQLPLGFLRRNGLLPIELTPDALVIATTDPFHVEALAAVAYLVDRPVAPHLISQQDFTSALKRLYEAP